MPANLVIGYYKNQFWQYALITDLLQKIYCNLYNYLYINVLVRF